MMYNCTSDEHADVVGVRVDYGGSALKSLVFRLRYGVSRGVKPALPALHAAGILMSVVKKLINLSYYLLCEKMHMCHRVYRVGCIL